MYEMFFVISAAYVVENGISLKKLFCQWNEVFQFDFEWAVFD